ncbi:hypothetical protein [Streptomyces sp. NPDC093568]|uniref:hypothetical protein n=1 Tax=Streptomyces sp. NPDC093568 TaxID=3366041 RepID=UPI00382197A1
MFIRRVAVAVTAAGVLGTAGCSSDEGGGVTERTDTAVSSSTGTPPSVSQSASPSSVPSEARTATSVPVTGPDQRLVTMVVTGGFAGVHQEVVLRGDGTVHTDKGEQAVRRADPAEFTELRTLLGDPALDEVSDDTRDMEAADLFQYTLRFDGRTVMTDRSVDEPALDRLIDALSEWLPRR